MTVVQELVKAKNIITHGTVRRWIQHGIVYLNGETVSDTNCECEVGDIIQVKTPRTLSLVHQVR